MANAITISSITTWQNAFSLWTLQYAFRQVSTQERGVLGYIADLAPEKGAASIIFKNYGFSDNADETVTVTGVAFDDCRFPPRVLGMKMERVTGLEPVTSTLARLRSTS